MREPVRFNGGPFEGMEVVQFPFPRLVTRWIRGQKHVYRFSRSEYQYCGEEEREEVEVIFVGGPRDGFRIKMKMPLKRRIVVEQVTETSFFRTMGAVRFDPLERFEYDLQNGYYRFVEPYSNIAIKKKVEPPKDEGIDRHITTVDDE
jgi:hypothetical protein